jgi:glycosyltransferase involved in cell wall biosynthesis
MADHSMSLEAMTQHKPAFSVVIPVYNRPDYAKACLAAFLRPEAAGIEVIVVDDGSADDTADTVEALGATSQGATIRLIRQQNAGPGPARNRGCAAASADWVIFHDSDDLWLPWTIASLRDLLSRPEAATATVLFMAVERFQTPDSLQALAPAPLTLRCHDTLLDMRLNDPLSMIASCNVGMRRGLFDALGGFSDAVRHGEDTDLFYRAGDRGSVLVVAAPVMMGYRLSQPGSASLTNSGDKIRNMRTKFLLERNRAGLYPGPARKRAIALARTVAFTVRGYFSKGYLGPAYRVWWQGLGVLAASGQWATLAKLPLTPLLHYLRPARYPFRWKRSGGGVS